jgi:hypothetical protein
MARRINLQQRAYLLGYLRGFRKARAELRALAASMDQELAALQAEIGEIATDYKNITEVAQALAERDPQARLH